jgi:hypothetical protein
MITCVRRRKEEEQDHHICSTRSGVSYGAPMQWFKRPAMCVLHVFSGQSTMWQNWDSVHNCCPCCCVDLLGMLQGQGGWIYPLVHTLTPTVDTWLYKGGLCKTSRCWHAYLVRVTVNTCGLSSTNTTVITAETRFLAVCHSLPGDTTSLFGGEDDTMAAIAALHFT